MSWTHKQRITVVAIVVLVVAMPVLWQIGQIGATQEAEEKQADIVNQTVQERQAPEDHDGDGIADSKDTCPTRPETENDFQDSDGCPDIVETTGAS